MRYSIWIERDSMDVGSAYTIEIPVVEDQDINGMIEVLGQALGDRIVIRGIGRDLDPDQGIGTGATIVVVMLVVIEGLIEGDHVPDRETAILEGIEVVI